MPTRHALLGVALLALATLPARAGADEPVALRLGHVGVPGSLFDLTATEFAKRANAALKGRLEVVVSGNSEFGSDEQMLEGVRAGSPEMFLPAGIMSTVEARFGVFEMPYLVTGRAHMRRIAENRAVQEHLFAGLPAKGLRALGVWELGSRHITNNVRPIVRPEDLRGIRLRVPSGVWRVRTFQDYGAVPTDLPTNEVYAALKLGKVEGQENPFAQMWPSKFHEVQRYLSLSGHVYAPAYLVIGQDVWRRLPRDVQKTLGTVAWEMGDFARAEGERLDREYMAKMSAAMTVNEVDRDAFLRASSRIYERFASEVPGGGALIRAIQTLR
jgi:tripartite ATP-independent transporter DctP family solute receptor